MIAYLVASTCIVEVKSRRRRLIEYETTPKIMPNPAPMRIADSEDAQPGAGGREDEEQQAEERAEPGARCGARAGRPAPA